MSGIGFGGGTPIGKDPDPTPEAPPETTPPRAVSEELVWRARAVRAEARATELEARISEIERELTSARTQAQQATRAKELELELALAGAVDLETTMLLAQHTLEQDDAADVSTVVADLKRRKPFLFRSAAVPSAMSQSVAPVGTMLDELAEEARQSGDRASVLKYLRARRTN